MFAQRTGGRESRSATLPCGGRLCHTALFTVDKGTTRRTVPIVRRSLAGVCAVLQRQRLRACPASSRTPTLAATLALGGGVWSTHLRGVRCRGKPAVYCVYCIQRDPFFMIFWWGMTGLLFAVIGRRRWACWACSRGTAASGMRELPRRGEWSRGMRQSLVALHAWRRFPGTCTHVLCALCCVEVRMRMEAIATPACVGTRAPVGVRVASPEGRARCSRLW